MQSRPSSTAPGHAHSPGDIDGTSASEPARGHAPRGVEERIPDACHNAQPHCIPATLAEEAEGAEAHEGEIDLGRRAPPTLQEEDTDHLQHHEASFQGGEKAADMQDTERDSVVMHSQPDEASGGVPEATLPAELQDTLRELAPTLALQSQPEEARPDGEQSIAHADSREVPQLPARIAEALGFDPADSPFGLWSTASGKPLQVSAAALQAAQARFNADEGFALRLDGQLDSELEAEHASQAVHDSPDPSEPAEHSAAQHADEATAPGSEPGQLRVMPSPMQQEHQSELDSRAGFQQLAPALSALTAAEQADAPTIAAASIWGTASGKPVHFSKERMRAAAAIFGEDFPVTLSPDPADAAATVTWTTGSDKSLLGHDKEPWQPGIAQVQDTLAAVMSIEAESHAAVVAPAAAAGHPSFEAAASPEVTERNRKRNRKRSNSGGTANEAEGTPARGGAEAEMAMPWQTASGKRLRVSLEALAAAASKLHLTSEPDHGPNEAEETPARGDGGAETAVPWQTASGKQMRVSPEALAAAASRLHLTSGPENGQSSSSRPPPLLADASKGSTAQAASPAQQALQGLGAVAENSSAPDPSTPLQQQPGGRAGQLSASTAGRKRSAQLPSGPGQSRARSGSTFKAPRKFMTPVSKFALQQACLNPPHVHAPEYL